MPVIKKNLGEGHAYLSDAQADFEENSLRSILVSMNNKLDELIEHGNTHTHDSGSSPNESVDSNDVTVE